MNISHQFLDIFFPWFCIICNSSNIFYSLLILFTYRSGEEQWKYGNLLLGNVMCSSLSRKTGGSKGWRVLLVGSVGSLHSKWPITDRCIGSEKWSVTQTIQSKAGTSKEEDGCDSGEWVSGFHSLWAEGELRGRIGGSDSNNTVQHKCRKLNNVHCSLIIWFYLTFLWSGLFTRLLPDDSSMKCSGFTVCVSTEKRFKFLGHVFKKYEHELKLRFFTQVKFLKEQLMIQQVNQKSLYRVIFSTRWYCNLFISPGAILPSLSNVTTSVYNGVPASQIDACLVSFFKAKHIPSVCQFTQWF